MNTFFLIVMSIWAIISGISIVNDHTLNGESTFVKFACFLMWLFGGPLFVIIGSSIFGALMSV